MSAGLVGLLIYFRALIIIAIIVEVLMIVANWAMFNKAGEKGWKSIIPVYSTAIKYKIAGINPYLAIPTTIIYTIVYNQDSIMKIMKILKFSLKEQFHVFRMFKDFNDSAFYYIFIAILFVFVIWESIKIAKAFGNAPIFGVGLLLLPFIFYPILAFGRSSVYNPQFKYGSGKSENPTGSNNSVNVGFGMNNITNQNINTMTQANNQDVSVEGNNSSIQSNNIEETTKETKQEPVAPNIDLSSYGSVGQTNNIQEQSSQEPAAPDIDLSSYGTIQNNNNNNNTESSDNSEEKVNPDDLW